MFSLIDTGRLFAAVIACGLVIALPGFALARAARIGVRANTGILDGVVLGLAVLPFLYSMTIRFLGVEAALGLAVALGAVALIFARDAVVARAPASDHNRHRRVVAAIAVLLWLFVVVVEWIDIDVAGRLFQPMTVVDAVKHAATTQAILDTGAPPRDPFFLRSEHASYYYFFYTLPALAERICGGLIDARAAVGGAVFWTGLGLFGLIRLTIERSGLDQGARLGRVRMLTLAIMLASGLDILGVLRMGFLQGTWLVDPLFWNEQVAGWLESLLWVPHHVTGLIASTLGLMALCDAVGPCDAGAARLPRIAGVIIAAVCFASALGLSIWVTLGLVGTLALWSALLVVERRWHALGLVALAGLLALVIALPQIGDLRAGRSLGGPSPIVATVRAFTPIDGLVGAGPWRLLARLVALPVNYFAGFGVLASGAILFWFGRERFRQTEFGRVLALAAIAGLLLGAFLKSTLFNNDLGWRVVLFPLLAGTVWTIVALDRLLEAQETLQWRCWRLVPRFVLLLLVLGWATSLYALVGLRAYPWTANEPDYRFMAADPTTERALRVAYGWADANLPVGAVLQHDPTRPRAFAFALYGRHPTAVADSFGSLFGASPKAVDARIDALAPLFRTVLPPASVRAAAMANGVDDLVVTAADPLWSMPDGFVWHVKPVYVSDRVRIIPVAAIGDDAGSGSSSPRRESRGADISNGG